MAKKVRIPKPRRQLTNHEELVEVNAATIGEAQSGIVILSFAGIFAA